MMSAVATKCLSLLAVDNHEAARIAELGGVQAVLESANLCTGEQTEEEDVMSTAMALVNNTAAHKSCIPALATPEMVTVVLGVIKRCVKEDAPPAAAVAAAATSTTAPVGCATAAPPPTCFTTD
jgi:hypothetical protein